MFRLSPLLLACVAGTGVSHATAQTIERIKLTDNELNCQQIYAEIQQMDTAIQLAGPGMPSAPPGTQVITQNAVPQPQAVQQAMPTVNGLQGAVIADPNVQAAVARARAQGMSEAQINATIGLGMQRGGLGAPTGATLAQMHAPTAAVMTQQGISPAMQQQIANNMAGAQIQNRGIAAAPAQYAQAAGAAAGLAGMFGALAGMGAKPAAAAAPAAPVAVAQAPAAGTTNSLGAQAKARKDHLTGFFLTRGCKMSEIQK